jgi:hypothetical protein
MGETEMEAGEGIVARHLETMRRKHDITPEHLRMGALKGEILDADGSVITNCVARARTPDDPRKGMRR